MKLIGKEEKEYEVVNAFESNNRFVILLNDERKISIIAQEFEDVNQFIVKNDDTEKTIDGYTTINRIKREDKYVNIKLVKE